MGRSEPRMYGVPADLDLSFLNNAWLYQVWLMPRQINFMFDPDGQFFVEGEWELSDAQGVVIDRHLPWPRSQPFHFHRLLGQAVTGCEVSAPEWLAIRFSNGDVLRLFDSSPQYESFVVQSQSIATVVV